MNLKVNPLTSFRITGVEVSLGGRELLIPALPSAVWLPVLWSDSMLDVLYLSDDYDVIDDVILGGEISEKELRATIEETIAVVCGRPAHAAQVLAVAAEQRWDVVGADLARRGFRFDLVSIGAALDAIYGVIASGMKEEDLAKFQKILAGQVTPEGPAPSPVPASALPFVRERPKTRPRPERVRRDGLSEKPKRPRGGRARSGPSPMTVDPVDEATPASDTASRPHQTGPRRRASSPDVGG